MMVAAIVIAQGITVLPMVFLQCRSLAMAWNPTLGGTYIHQRLWARYVSIPNTVIDVALLVLPLSVIWSIWTTLARRMGLTCVFLLGGLYALLAY